MHYTGNNNDTTDARKNFRIYQLEDYTEELAGQHTLNGAQGNKILKESLQQTTKTVIDTEFLK